MKRFLRAGAAAAAFGCATSASAVDWLVVVTPETTIPINMNLQPKVTFVDGKLHVADKYDDYGTFERATIKAYTYMAQEITPADRVDAQRPFELVGDDLMISAPAADKTMSIYNTSGNLLASIQLKAGEQRTVSLHTIATGVLLVSLDGKTYKIAVR